MLRTIHVHGWARVKFSPPKRGGGKFWPSQECPPRGRAFHRLRFSSKWPGRQITPVSPISGSLYPYIYYNYKVTFRVKIGSLCRGEKLADCFGLFTYTPCNTRVVQNLERQSRGPEAFSRPWGKTQNGKPSLSPSYLHFRHGKSLYAQ